MLSALHSGLTDPAAHLNQQWVEAQPFHHVVIDPFLEPGFCQELVDGFPSFQEKDALNEYGEVGGKAVVSDLASIGPAYQRFDQLMRDGDFLFMLGRMTGIPDLLYDPEYIGGGTHENLSGQELDTHVDFNYHPTTQLHRRLNLILFLNPEWEASWGGSLELLRDPFSTEPGNTKFVLPVANRAVIFETTEASWHGFRKIRIPAGKRVSRRSIAVYFYTRERPPAETAPSHATVYYMRPLAANIQPGHTLDANDVQELQILLTRRDTYAKFLYEREKEFSDAIAGRDWRIRNFEARIAELEAQIALHDEQSRLLSPERDAAIAERDERIRACQARIGDLEAEITDNQRYLQAIHDSPSMKLGKVLTWPARALRAALRAK